MTESGFPLDISAEEMEWLNGIIEGLQEGTRSAVREIQVGDRYTPTAEGYELLIEAYKTNFLVEELRGKCKLSEETRRMEEKRQARKLKKRKKYTFHYGHVHHNKQKAKERRRKDSYWVEGALERLKVFMKCPVTITQEEWDKYIQPIWRVWVGERGENRRRFKFYKKGESMGVYNTRIWYVASTRKARTPTLLLIYDGFEVARREAEKREA